MNVLKVRLGDLCTIGRGSSPRPIKDERYFVGGTIPWVKIADATASGKYIFNTGMFVNEYGASFSRRLSPGSLIFPASGTLGIPRFLGVEACIHDGWLYFSDFEGIDPEYLYYKLITLKDYYISIAYGAAIQNINTDLVRDTVIDLPSMTQQKAIASYLGNYDELIEANRKRIALLEEYTRLLYREWFVSFRYPGHKDVDLIELPQGWMVRTLTELAVVNGASLGTKDKPEQIQYVDIASVETGTVLGATKMQYADAPGRARRLVRHGDVIWSCVRPNRRSYALMWAPDDDVVVSTGFAVLTASSVPFSYLYFATTSDEFVAYLTNRATGAAYPAVSGKDFEEAPLLCPSSEVLQSFDEKCLPILELRSKLILQNEHLTEARNALLPKIMSGELAI
jgi:type I restriction enzyme, S subunit